MTGHQKNNLSVLTMGHGRHLDRVSRPIFSPKIWFLSDPGIPASRSKVSTLTVFVLYPLPRLLWSALTKLDGGGEENVVSDGITFLYPYSLFSSCIKVEVTFCRHKLFIWIICLYPDYSLFHATEALDWPFHPIPRFDPFGSGRYEIRLRWGCLVLTNMILGWFIRL